MKKLLILIVPLLLVGCRFMKLSDEIDLIPFAQKDKWGYIDLKGNIVINPQFSEATLFREGLALVQTSGKDQKWGYIDKEGKFVINAVYKRATVFQEGLAWVVTENGPPTAIDKEGEVMFKLKEAEEVRLFSEDLAAFSKSDSIDIWGFVDKSGKQVIIPQFIDVKKFSDDKCAVQNKEGKWGYIDKSGKLVINYQFEKVGDFEDGKAVVYSDDKAGVIDNDGKYEINPQFEKIEIDGDKFLIWQDGKAGWCDKAGKIIINPQFDDAAVFGDSGLALIRSFDKYGYIDREGKIMINPQFDFARPFIGDIALLQNKKGKWGLIDKEGKYIVNPQFDGVGIDLYCHLFENSSSKSSVRSDYLDVDKILEVINIGNPEKIDFKNDIEFILNKKPENYSVYEDSHYIYKDVIINSDVKYNYAVWGTINYRPNLNDYEVSNETVKGFVHEFSFISGKGENREELFVEAFEKKLKGYKLMKKGYINEARTSVYESVKTFVLTLTPGHAYNDVEIYILDKDWDFESYLKKIRVEKPVEEIYDSSVPVTADTTAAY